MDLKVMEGEIYRGKLRRIVNFGQKNMTIEDPHGTVQEMQVQAKVDGDALGRLGYWQIMKQKIALKGRQLYIFTSKKGHDMLKMHETEIFIHTR